MTRLRLLAAAVFVLAAARPARAVTEEDLVAGAQAQIKVGCACSTDACPKLKTLVADYLNVLRAAEQCAAAKCEKSRVMALFRTDEALDAAEGKLPDPARARVDGERPLLRLSLLVSMRSAQALALTAPGEKPPLRFDPDVDGPRSVERLCINAPASCADGRGTLSEVKELVKKVGECEAKKCAFAELDEAGARAERTMHRYALASRSDVDTLPLFALVRNVEERLVRLVSREANERLVELSKGVGSLETGVADFSAHGGDRVGLEAKVVELSRAYRDAELGASRADSFLLQYGKSGISRDRLNASAARLAAARSRLVAAETADGLSTMGGAVPDAVNAAGGKKTVAYTKAGTDVPTLIDRRTIPAPPPASPKSATILDRKPSALEIAKDIFSEDPMKKADARHRAGLSYTVGDPAGRARLVHGQTHPDTCAVVSQQEVLTSLKLLPLGDPVKTEDQLRDEAFRRGFYREGTPDVYTAELLVDRGVIVTKRAGAPLKDLDAAVRRGGMVIANVDARWLWNIPAKAVLGHAVVIVGAEVDRFSGETLGYYVNDSGSAPPGQARYTPIATFQKAWDAHTRSFAEVR